MRISSMFFREKNEIGGCYFPLCEQLWKKQEIMCGVRRGEMSSLFKDERKKWEVSCA